MRALTVSRREFCDAVTCTSCICGVVVVNDGFGSSSQCVKMVFCTEFTYILSLWFRCLVLWFCILKSIYNLEQNTVVIERVPILRSFMCFQRRGRGQLQRRAQWVCRLSCHLFCRGRSVKQFLLLTTPTHPSSRVSNDVMLFCNE